MLAQYTVTKIEEEKAPVVVETKPLDFEVSEYGDIELAFVEPLAYKMSLEKLKMTEV